MKFYFTLIFCLIAIGYIILLISTLKNKKSDSLLAMESRKPDRKMSFVYWLSPLFFISIWGIVSGFSTLRNFPSPIDVIQSFFNLLISGKLLFEAAVSFKRVAIAFCSAAIIGVPIGLFAGAFVLVNKIILPVNSFLRYIPPTAFVSLLIVYLGVGEMFKYTIIFLGMIFFIIQMVTDVVDDVDMKYIELGKTSGFSNWEIFKKVIVPFSMPRVFDVLRINIGAAWTFLVVAEIVGSDRGLGHLIAISQRFMRIDDLYAGILTFGIIGLITDRLLSFCSRKLYKWYYIELNR